MTRRQSDTSQTKLARDARSGATITLRRLAAPSRPRAIFVTAKRGSGKTTTLHTIATHAAEDIAPAVERAGVQTLIFDHSHIPDRAKFGLADGTLALIYINTGTWTNVIALLSAVAPPTRTYAHVDDDGTARLLQWTGCGPAEPIIFGK